MKNWEVFTEKQPKRRNVIATLNGYSDRPLLYIGGKLRHLIKKGDKFTLLFDRQNLLIGLRKSDTGLKAISVNIGGLVLSAAGFCDHFNLHRKYTVKEFYVEDETIVLPLTELA